MHQGKEKIAIIDYGMGNICSVQKACAFLGYEGVLVEEPEKLMTATKAILPGVGAFGDAMAVLDEKGFTGAIKEYVAQGRPFFGICLGMQLMFAGSTEGLTEVSSTPATSAASTPAASALSAPASASLTIEAPPHKGLGFFPGIIRRFPTDAGVKIPHIGWNLVEHKPDSALFAGLPSQFNAYFVHSYFAGDTQAHYAAGLCSHGLEFLAAVEEGNLWAAQFHPEKSGDLGIRLLYNFLRRNPYAD